MLTLVVGAKGGLGTTSLTLHLVRAARGVGLDLADGQLAARLDRAAWSLARPAFVTAAQRREAIEHVVKRRVTLLWTTECHLVEDEVWGFVRAVADRTAVVADGGIQPPEEVAGLADAVIVVSGDTDVAQYHERRLRERFPEAVVVMLPPTRRELRGAARELAQQVFG